MNHLNQRLRSRLPDLALILFFFSLWSTFVDAQTYTYNSGAPYGYWDVGTNWTPNGVPNSITTSVIIPSTAGTATIDLDGMSETVNQLNSMGTNIQITNGTLVLDGNNPAESSSDNVASLATTGNLVITSALQFNRPTIFSTAPGEDIQIDGAFGGNSGFTVLSGTVTIGGTGGIGQYSGPTTVDSSGLLQLLPTTHPNSLAGPLIIDGGTVVDEGDSEVGYSGRSTTTLQFTSKGGQFLLSGSSQEVTEDFAGLNGVGLIQDTYNGPAVLGPPAGVNLVLSGAANYVFGGQIVEGTYPLTLSCSESSGTQELDGANSYSWGHRHL